MPYKWNEMGTWRALASKPHMCFAMTALFWFWTDLALNMTDSSKGSFSWASEIRAWAPQGQWHLHQTDNINYTHPFGTSEKFCQRASAHILQRPKWRYDSCFSFPLNSGPLNRRGRFNCLLMWLKRSNRTGICNTKCKAWETCWNASRRWYGNFSAISFPELSSSSPLSCIWNLVKPQFDKEVWIFEMLSLQGKFAGVTYIHQMASSKHQMLSVKRHNLRHLRLIACIQCISELLTSFHDWREGSIVEWDCLDQALTFPRQAWCPECSGQLSQNLRLQRVQFGIALVCSHSSHGLALQMERLSWSLALCVCSMQRNWRHALGIWQRSLKESSPRAKSSLM